MPEHDDVPISTFSVVGYDPDQPAWGIAVASRFLAVGARTCWGEPGVGVVVVQAHFNPRNGPEGVDLLRRGLSAEDVIDRLMAKDSYRDLRQMAVVDGKGSVATYTGIRCTPWAGGLVGKHSAAQGNMLVSGKGVEAMVAYVDSSSKPLARRLVDALAKGDAEGGDARGRQAAALYVARPSPGEPVDVFSYRTIDLRVDDHPNPFVELSRLLDLYELVHHPATLEERLSPTPDHVVRLQAGLARLGYFSGDPSGVMDDATREALRRLAYYHGLRRRLSEAGWIDKRVLEYVEARSADGGLAGGCG